MTGPCPECGHVAWHVAGCSRAPGGKAANAEGLAHLAGRLAPDEPVFVLRGQDVLAPLAIQQYAEGLRRAGRESDAADVEQRGIEFLRWQAANRDRVKLPD
jgi:hypothetical protein